jgi:hypothetical protein
VRGVPNEKRTASGEEWRRVRTAFRAPSIRRFHFEVPDVEWVTWRRVLMPPRFAALIWDARYPVRVEVELEGGYARCVGLTRIAEPFGLVDDSGRRPRRREKGPPITAELLREIPLKRLVGEVAAEAEKHFGRRLPTVEKELQRDAELYARLAKLAKRTQSRPDSGVSDALLAEVAEIYDAAVAAGSASPTRATWEALRTRRKGKGKPAYSTVARWVSIARDRGLLPPTHQGKARGWRAREEQNDG